MTEIPLKVVRSFLSTRETYERRRKFAREGTECAFATMQAKFAQAMAKLRLLRATGGSRVQMEMAGDELGASLRSISYYRGRYPQLSDKHVRQEELPLGV